MNRDQKINLLMERGDEDVRRLALDVIDLEARTTSTFGSKAHRTARDAVEAKYNEARRAFEAYSEAQLDAAVAAPV